MGRFGRTGAFFTLSPKGESVRVREKLISFFLRVIKLIKDSTNK
jgi:hypothetical protein